MHRFHLRLSEILWRNHGVVRALERYLEANDVPELARFKVITCMVEAVSNVVCHTDVPLNEITLVAECEDGKVCLEVADPSHVFDVSWSVNEPDAQDQRGRGLWIIHNWMNAVSHVVCAQGTRLRMELVLD